MSTPEKTSTRGRRTSFHSLFARSEPGVAPVTRIEIPLIQRDYAQGRESTRVERIRSSFLQVLHAALAGGKPVCLDFVYGDVENGRLQPLDGQQRLTTLFLLHWYLASRVGCLDQETGWKNFTYETRASARLFCQRLVQHALPMDETDVPAWIEDQSWYLRTWRHDPTIRSMRVMLGAIADLFRGIDATAAWARLTDIAAPAIDFHLLPIERMGLSEDLYIKMNSRGKLLTEFENFKAAFEQTLERACPQRVEEFARRVDGPWADVFWLLRGNDNVVDDEFLRYFQFVTELCEWRGGVDSRMAGTEITEWTEQVYGQDQPGAAANLEFLFQALDLWHELDIPAEFGRWFALEAAPLDSGDTSKVVLFDAGGSVDLFAGCCRTYGATNNGDSRAFGWRSILLLYAVVLHYLHETADFPRRLRLLRNVLEASEDELRFRAMPKIVADVYRIIVDRTLDGVTTLNQAQVKDERLKAAFLQQAADAGHNAATIERTMFQLEDHWLLRGRLFAFELDLDVFTHRAEAFHRVFAPGADQELLTAALLATGDYSRRLNWRFFQFGRSHYDAPWRRLLTDGTRDLLENARAVLGQFLDGPAAVGTPEAFAEVVENWLAACERAGMLDWRYYFVKYPAMREGTSGMYAGRNGRLGYDVCMLNNQNMKGNFRDPYLSAIHWASGMQAAVDDPKFSGLETEPRYLRLVKSGTRLQCIPAGLRVLPSDNPGHAAAAAAVWASHGIEDDGLWRAPQSGEGETAVDTRDRVAFGAQLLRELVAADL